MTASNRSFVVLRNGVSVPLDALRLLWELEDRGLHIHDDGDALAVGPRAQLTDFDRAAIRRHRDSLRILVAACEAVQ